MIDNLKTFIGYKTTHEDNNKVEFVKLFNKVHKELDNLQLQEINFSDQGYQSCLWSTRNNPDLLLISHVDVVSGKSSQFIPKVEDGKLYGRGAIDMKFAISVFIQLLNNLPDLHNRSIGLLLTSDEEIGGMHGVKYVLDKTDIKPKCVLMPDGGTNMTIEQSEKGILHIQLQAKGVSAHGSRPWLGDNAIDKLIDAYLLLKRQFPNPKNEQWTVTLNAGKVNGGTATNAVPDEATMNIDIRVPTKTDRTQVLNYLNKISQGDVSYKVLIEGANFELPTDSSYLKKYQNSAKKVSGRELDLIKSAGSSDARFFAEKNIPVIINRPIGDGHHTDNEWINLESIEQFYKITFDFVDNF